MTPGADDAVKGLTPARFGGTVRDSLALLRPDAGLFAFVLAVNLVGAALTGIGDPMALKLVVDSLSDANIRFFLILTGLMIFIYGSYRALSYVSSLGAQRLRNRLTERLVSQLVSRFYQLPYPRVAGGEKGYFISRIYDEPAKVAQVVTVLVDLFASAMICVCALSVCLYLSWKVTLMVSCLVPVLVFLSRRYGSRIRRTSLVETEAEAQLREGLGRAVDGYKNVRMFRLHGVVHRHFDGLLNLYLDSLYARYRQGAAFRGLSGWFLSTAETVVMIVAGLQVVRGGLSLGGLFGFVSAYWRVVNSFHSMASVVPNLATANAHLERVREMLDGPTRDGEEDRPVAADGDWGLVNAVAGYGGPPVLNGLSLRWSDGESVLVVGANGCGKSTLAHVLSGFLPTDSGDARLPGLARTSALLPPFGFLPGTLRDNLTHASEDLGGEGYVRRLAADFGLAERLDEDPATFSDGQKKRAQILMTLAKDADCYLLDEPLANVDPESKDQIIEAIFQRSEGRGLIVILHGDERFHSRFDRVVDLSAAAQALSVPA